MIDDTPSPYDHWVTMQSNQERLYIASTMAGGVADCLIEFSSYSEAIEVWNLMELASQPAGNSRRHDSIGELGLELIVQN